MSCLIEDKISTIEDDVYIITSNIPQNCHLFRAANYPGHYVISEELAAAMKNAGITGYRLEETIQTS